MSKIYAQKYPVLASCTSGCVSASGTVSASLMCHGYASILGYTRSDQALDAACGLKVRQSVDGGINWDIESGSNAIGANGSAACSISVLGNAVQVTVMMGSTEASAFRMLWQLKPI